MLNFIGGFLLLVYSGATWFLYAAAWPVLRLLSAGRGGESRGWAERLGRLPRAVGRGTVWLHGASVGEITALASFVREIRKVRPRTRLLVWAMTAAGKRRAGELFGCPAVHPPLDAPQSVRRALGTAAPRALIVAETELWPVLLSSAARRMPVAWVNGRISGRSFLSYMLVRPLVRRIFSGFKLLCVISALDARRAVRLGAASGRVQVMGNLKADMVTPASPPRGVPGGLWFVAGSTREGEEEAALRAYAAAKKRFPRLKLCLAPRHLHRSGAAETLAVSMGFRVARRSAGAQRASRCEVLILDTHGELASFYRLARAAFVGGTLARIGGHNVLEPAVSGIPVLFGPHTSNVREEAEGLVKCGGGFRVSSAAALANRLGTLLASNRLARKAGRRAREFVRSRQGAARRAVALMAVEGII